MKNKKFIPVILGALLTCSLLGCNDTQNSVSSELEIQQYSISYVESEYCDITLSKTQATRNEVVEVKISNILSGYELQKITANDMRIDGYSFLMPNEDVVIKTYFKVVENGDLPSSEGHKVVIHGNEYAVITTDYDYYLPGAEVKINYSCKGNYVLGYFEVNDKAIEGKSFVMPDEDVVIKGYFYDAIGESENQTYCYAGGVLSKAYWFFRFDDNFLNVNVKVIDRFVCGRAYKSDYGLQDNIEFIVSEKTTSSNYVPNKTWKVLVSCDSDYYLQKANSATTWGPTLTYQSTYFNTISSYKYLSRGDGYDGYEVKINFAYSLLGLTKEQAMNNISIGMAMRNTIDVQMTNWNHDHREGFIFENPSTHPVLMSDGLLK